eukprot:ctg_1005.g391
MLSERPAFAIAPTNRSIGRPRQLWLPFQAIDPRCARRPQQPFYRPHFPFASFLMQMDGAPDPPAPNYVSPLSTRYASAAMRSNFADEARFRTWRQLAARGGRPALSAAAARGGRLRKAVAARRDGARARAGRSGAGGAAYHPLGRHFVLRDRQLRAGAAAAGAGAAVADVMVGDTGAGRVRWTVSRFGHAGLHPFSGGTADHRRQACLSVDSGPDDGRPAVRGGGRVAAVSRRQGHHRHASIVPSAVPRRSRQGEAAGRGGHPQDGLCAGVPGHRADVPAQAGLCGVGGAGGSGSVGRQVCARGQLGDGIQAQPDALGAHQQFGALSADAAAEPGRDREHARGVSGHRCDSAASAEREPRVGGVPQRDSQTLARGAAVYGHRAHIDESGTGWWRSADAARGAAATQRGRWPAGQAGRPGKRLAGTRAQRCALRRRARQLDGLCDGALFIGRAPEQVDDFLKELVWPALESRRELLDACERGAAAGVLRV